jgi:hypothetical protein
LAGTAAGWGGDCRFGDGAAAKLDQLASDSVMARATATTSAAALFI